MYVCVCVCVCLCVCVCVCVCVAVLRTTKTTSPSPSKRKRRTSSEYVDQQLVIKAKSRRRTKEDVGVVDDDLEDDVQTLEEHRHSPQTRKSPQWIFMTSMRRKTCMVSSMRHYGVDTQREEDSRNHTHIDSGSSISPYAILMMLQSAVKKFSNSSRPHRSIKVRIINSSVHHLGGLKN